MRKGRNDRDRAQWIDNHEPLYQWHRRSRMPILEFIKAHRDEIDEIIDAVLNQQPRRN